MATDEETVQDHRWEDRGIIGFVQRESHHALTFDTIQECHRWCSNSNHWSAYSNLNEDEQMIINNVMLNGILNEDEKNEYLSAVMKLVSIILEDDAYVASIVLYKMLNKGYCKGRSK